MLRIILQFFIFKSIFIRVDNPNMKHGNY